MIKEYSLNYKVNSVLVFGLPGSGKTYLIDLIREKFPHYTRLSGGSLINAVLTDEQRDSLRVLASSQVIGNQEILISNFWRKINEDNISHVIFDGHLMVRGPQVDTVIPLDVIRKLSPDLMIFLDASVERILAQRKADLNRPDRACESPKSLEDERSAQLKLFASYGQALEVDALIYSGADIAEIIEKIESLG